VFDDADAIGGAVWHFEHVGLLGEVVNDCSLAAGFGTNHQDLELSEVVHLV